MSKINSLNVMDAASYLVMLGGIALGVYSFSCDDETRRQIMGLKGVAFVLGGMVMQMSVKAERTQKKVNQLEREVNEKDSLIRKQSRNTGDN